MRSKIFRLVLLVGLLLGVSSYAAPILINGTLAPNGVFPIVDGPVQAISYSNATRPVASTFPAGTMIWNSDSLTIQRTDGASWADVGGVTSVSNSDGTLTISPTTGAVVASLNLNNANVWAGIQTLTTPVIKNGLTATGSTANDFSGSTGTFLTSTGAVTVGPGAVGMTGATTFSGGILASGANANNFSGGSGTFLTSTGANTLSGNVTISDTKTLTGSFNGNGTSQNVFATIQNTTAALVGAQQYSPMECWLGKTWETTGPSSQTSGWCAQAQGFNGTTAHSVLTFYENSNSALTIMLGFRRLAAGGAQIVARDPSDITAISSFIQVSNQGGTKLSYNDTVLVTAGSVLLTLQGNATDAATATNIQAQTNQAMTISGSAVMRVVANSNTGTYITAYSGNSTIACAVAVDRIADTGGVTTNKVVVYTGTGVKVQDAAATNNLTTIAGIALTSATSGNATRVCIKGTALTGADAGITTGQLVGTSAASAGNVQSGTPPALGQVVGRATENTGATSANKVTVDVTLD